MKIKVIVYEAEERGYWAEVPSFPGCATQGKTFDELLNKLYEAVERGLSIPYMIYEQPSELPQFKHL